MLNDGIMQSIEFQNILVTILSSIGLAWIGARMALMLVDFMTYGAILGFIKKRLAGINIENSPSIQSAKITANNEYNKIATNNKLMAFLQCEYCISIWTSTITAIAASLVFGLSLWTWFLTPIIAYYIIDKTLRG